MNRMVFFSANLLKKRRVENMEHAHSSSMAYALNSVRQKSLRQKTGSLLLYGNALASVRLCPTKKPTLLISSSSAFALPAILVSSFFLRLFFAKKESYLRQKKKEREQCASTHPGIKQTILKLKERNIGSCSILWNSNPTNRETFSDSKSCLSLMTFSMDHKILVLTRPFLIHQTGASLEE